MFRYHLLKVTSLQVLIKMLTRYFTYLLFEQRNSMKLLVAMRQHNAGKLQINEVVCCDMKCV